MDNVHRYQEQVVPAGDFKQRCLALLDQVAETGTPIVVTKRGRPVARVVPIPPPNQSLRGSLRVVTEDEEDLYSTGEVWEDERPE
jgi:prevent-host-death family protein